MALGIWPWAYGKLLIFAPFVSTYAYEALNADGKNTQPNNWHRLSYFCMAKLCIGMELVRGSEYLLDCWNRARGTAMPVSVTVSDLECACTVTGRNASLPSDHRPRYGITNPFLHRAAL